MKWQETRQTNGYCTAVPLQASWVKHRPGGSYIWLHSRLSTRNAWRVWRETVAA